MSIGFLVIAPKFFDTRLPRIIVPASRPPRVLSRGIAEAGWDAASCGLSCTHPPGGARATPPSRHYERDLRMQPGEARGHRRVRQRPKESPRRARGQKTAAVERREASV